MSNSAYQQQHSGDHVVNGHRLRWEQPVASRDGGGGAVRPGIKHRGASKPRSTAKKNRKKRSSLMALQSGGGIKSESTTKKRNNFFSKQRRIKKNSAPGIKKSPNATVHMRVTSRVAQNSTTTVHCGRNGDEFFRHSDCHCHSALSWLSVWNPSRNRYLKRREFRFKEFHR